MPPISELEVCFQVNCSQGAAKLFCNFKKGCHESKKVEKHCSSLCSKKVVQQSAFIKAALKSLKAECKILVKLTPKHTLFSSSLFQQKKRGKKIFFSYLQFFSLCQWFHGLRCSFIRLYSFIYHVSPPFPFAMPSPLPTTMWHLGRRDLSLYCVTK